MIVTLGTISAGMFSKKENILLFGILIFMNPGGEIWSNFVEKLGDTPTKTHVARNETKKRTKKNRSWWTKSPLSNQSVSLLKGWRQCTGVQMLIGSALQLMIAVSQSPWSPQHFRASLAQQADTKEVRSGNKENGVLKSKRMLMLASVDGKCLMMPWAHY